MSLASLELPLGIIFLGFGLIYGGYHWITSAHAGLPTPAGTVMLSALPILAGIQFLLGFIGYDIASVPTRSIHRSIQKRGVKQGTEAQ